MVRFSRVACVALPMILSVASIVCIIFIGTTGLNGTGAVRDGYFALIDTHEIKKKVGDSEYIGLPDSHDYSKQKDVYAIYLWNYCSGNLKDGSQELNFCSKPNRWFFDLYNLWSTWGVKIAEPGSKWYWLRTSPRPMLVAYNIALATSVLETLVGFSAIYSRWGSFATLFFSGLSSCTILAASALSTAVYSTLVRRINTLDNIHARRGTNLFIATWVGTLLSLAATVFWTFSTCCVSGKDKKKARVKPEKTPYTYDRVAEPYMDSGSDTQNLLQPGPREEGKGSHLEPYRHA